MVASTTPREDSASTTTPALMRPNSIISATKAIPFKKPRQALPISRLRQPSGRPSSPCTMLATDGSR